MKVMVLRTFSVALFLLCSRAEESRRLVVASHGRLHWIDAGTGEATLLHTGSGVYYGTFPGDAWPTPEGKGRPSFWTVSRRQGGPSDMRLQQEGGGSGSAFWDDGLGPERLLRIDAQSGELLEQVNLASRFTHDAVRTPDGNSVLLADTANGHIVELHYPSMRFKHRHEMFSGRDHINTLAPGDAGTLWAVLHRKGRPSSLVEANLVNGRPTGRRIDGFGNSAHGVVFLGGDSKLSDKEMPPLLTLDSKNGRLLLLKGMDEDVLWADPQKRFLKGLCVVGGVAYFGVNTWGSLEHRVSDSTTADVIALEIKTRTVLWRRTLQTAGTLNVITAPQLGVTAPYQPQPGWEVHADWHRIGSKTDHDSHDEADYDYAYAYTYEYVEESGNGGVEL